jgi:mRNA interferase MazF
MVIKRGEIWWADLLTPGGSEPGFRRPVLVVSAETFNRSSIQTVTAIVVTSNLRLAEAPGNVALKKRASGLAKDSVVNVSQVVTLDKRQLSKRVKAISPTKMQEVETGLCLVLGLPR